MLLNVSSLDLCCDACAREPRCVAWTWGQKRGQGYSDMCFLKGSTPRRSITKLYDDGFVSGFPLQVGRSIAVYEQQPGLSLFCFSLVLPWTYEPSLIAMQYDQRTSIFDCDEMSVYSNQVVEVAPGVKTIRIESDLQCQKGGEFQTALNTDIFLTLWASILNGGRYTHHDYTVKVDPDTVFFPDRLRGLAALHPEGPRGVYLNNCERGMHGPIEVFSRNAVNSFAYGKAHCIDHFNALCSGSCGWGEDMFIDQCMDKVLQVTRQFEPRLLVEDHCDPPPDWQSCHDAQIVAYHPFKTIEAYKACMQGSQQVAV